MGDDQRLFAFFELLDSLSFFLCFFLLFDEICLLLKSLTMEFFNLISEADLLLVLAHFPTGKDHWNC